MTEFAHETPRQARAMPAQRGRPEDDAGEVGRRDTLPNAPTPVRSDAHTPFTTCLLLALCPTTAPMTLSQIAWFASSALACGLGRLACSGRSGEPPIVTDHRLKWMPLSVERSASARSSTHTAVEQRVGRPNPSASFGAIMKSGRDRAPAGVFLLRKMFCGDEVIAIDASLPSGCVYHHCSVSLQFAHALVVRYRLQSQPGSRRAKGYFVRFCEPASTALAREDPCGAHVETSERSDSLSRRCMHGFGGLRSAKKVTWAHHCSVERVSGGESKGVRLEIRHIASLMRL